MQEKKSISRRKFLKAVTLTGGAAAAGSLLAACAGQTATGEASSQPSAAGVDNPPPTAKGNSAVHVTLDISTPDHLALASVGGTLALTPNDLDPEGMLVVRASETTVRAFSRKCTHAGCTVGGYEGGIASCPCHGSQFDQSGKAVRGPAGSPLKEYKTALSGNLVTIS